LGTVQIDGLHGVIGQQTGDGFFVFRRPIVPKRIAQSAPGRCKPHLICICVLNDQPPEHLRIFRYDSKTDRPTVVLYEEAEVVKAFLAKKLLGYLGKVVEGVREIVWVRRIAIAETRVVRRNHMESIREGGNEISVLVRGGWESVKKNQLRVSRRTGFTIGNLQAVDFFG
jgi:hypothetical protein